MKVTLIDYVLHAFFLSLYGLVKYIPSPVGDLLRWIAIRPFMAKLREVRIYEGVTFWYPYRIKVGTDVTLNEWVYLSGFGGLRIGDGVRIGHRTSVITSDHCYDEVDVPVRKQGLIPGEVIIEDDVWIGCNVTVLKGVTIEKGAVIAAGAVVTQRVPALAIMAGVPARQIGVRGKNKKP